MTHSLPGGGDLADGAYAWRRLAISLAISTIGGVGLWSAVLVLPAIQAEFGVDRAGASLPYTATLIGFAIGGVAMGRLADRFGIRVPLLVGALMLGLGYLAAAASASYWQFVLAQALLIGMLGSSPSFGPLVADVSHWFRRRRGIAVAIVASGNYLAGTIWPPILQHAIASVGWRATHVGIGVFCLATLLPLALLLAPPHQLDADPRPPAQAPIWRPAGRARPSFRASWCWPASPAASPCRCRRCTSSPTAPISATDLPAAPRCSR